MVVYQAGYIVLYLTIQTRKFNGAKMGLVVYISRNTYQPETKTFQKMMESL